MNKILSISILLPHCDDELFILPFIERELSKGAVVNIYFLVSASLVRQKESQKLFSQYPSIHVSHFGVHHHIADGKLSGDKEKVFSLLAADEKISSSSLIVTPAFEGGHVDHDELFVLGHELGEKFHVEHVCFSTYNAYRTWFVRVSSIRTGIMQGVFEEVNFSFRKGLRYLYQCTHFKSQFVILGILFPGLIRTFLFKRKIELLRVTSFHPEREHPGKVFYKNDFKKKVKAFLMVQ